MTIHLTRDETHQRMVEINARFEELALKDRMDKSEHAEFGMLRGEFTDLTEHLERLDRADAIARAAGEGGGGLAIDRGLATRERRKGSPSRDAALRVLDGLVSANKLPARAAEAAEAMTKTGSGLERSWTERMVEATGDDAYFRAFCRVLADPQRGHLLWDAEEQHAFQRVQQIRQEMRSMNSTDELGGFLAPVIIDPSIQISSDGNINPLRAISRNVKTVSDSWKGLTSASVTAHWTPEEQEVSDDSPTLGEVNIPVHKATAFIPASFEIIQDGTNFVSEMSKLLLDGLDQLTAEALTTGTGTDEPTGLITKLAATPGSVVATASADTIVAGDVYKLQAALPPRFQASAQWIASLPIINALRQLQTQNGSLVFPSLQDSQQTLLGKPISEVSNMDATLGGGAGNDNVIAYGRFDEFVVVDRWPATLEVISNLFGAARRPTGQRGFLLHARIGSDVLIPNAFRLLQA